MDNCNIKGVIYKIENKVNGKVYIGQTMKGFERRVQAHFSKLRNNSHNNNYLQNAFNKYGEQSFVSKPMEICSIDKLDDREIFWIGFFKQINRCYNLEDGGNKRKIISEETKKKLSVSSKRMWANEETKESILNALKQGKEHHSSRAVICLNDMRVFDSVTEASEYYGLHMKAVYDCAKGEFQYCHSKDKVEKFEFKFYEPGKAYKPEKHVHKLSKGVICITTGEAFESVTKAAEKYGLETTNISKVCKGKQRSTGRLPNGKRLKWAYYEDYKASR